MRPLRISVSLGSGLEPHRVGCLLLQCEERGHGLGRLKLTEVRILNYRMVVRNNHHRIFLPGLRFTWECTGRVCSQSGGDILDL